MEIEDVIKMTDDEIIGLSDEDMNHVAAELRGWVEIGSSDPRSPIWESHPWVDPRGVGRRTAPRYTYYISDAWDLWGQLVADDYEPSLTSFKGLHEIHLKQPGTDHRDLLYVDDKDAARAITIAFVMAKTMEDGE